MVNISCDFIILVLSIQEEIDFCIIHTAKMPQADSSSIPGLRQRNRMKVTGGIEKKGRRDSFITLCVTGMFFSRIGMSFHYFLCYKRVTLH